MRKLRGYAVLVRTALLITFLAIDTEALREALLWRSLSAQILLLVLGIVLGVILLFEGIRQSYPLLKGKGKEMGQP
jgi:hypothetical protein